jgi:hypothetical protein
MRKFLLVTSAAVCVLGTPAFATTGTDQSHSLNVAASVMITSQQLGSYLIQEARDAGIVVAANDDKDKDKDKTTNGCSEGNDNVVSRSKPCKGNNGFGNGGGDGSPNGKQDITR